MLDQRRRIASGRRLVDRRAGPVCHIGRLGQPATHVLARRVMALALQGGIEYAEVGLGIGTGPDGSIGDLDRAT